MALYSLSTKPISRKAGRSSVAAAAYRSGARLVDERTGVEHDYTRKRGVEHVELVAPEGINIDSSQVLWNRAEAAENRRDGRTAREVLIALPAELDAGQRTELAQAITRDLVERYGVAAELAIHAPDRDGDKRNHHAHVLITTRRLNHDGFGVKSQLEMSDTQLKKHGLPKSADELKNLRERWANLQNAALERAGVDARVDHRSQADQGSGRVAQIHQGSYATQMIRQGTPERSERATLNLEIIAANTEYEQALEEWERPGREAWEAWTNHSAVDSSGRIMPELWVDEVNQQGWQQHLAIEAAEELLQADQRLIPEIPQAPQVIQEPEPMLQPETTPAVELQPQPPSFAERLREAEQQRDTSNRAVHQIDDELKKLVAQRDSLSFFRFGAKRDIRERIDELVEQRNEAYAEYRQLASNCDDLVQEQRDSRSTLLGVAAKIRADRPAEEPSLREPEREQQHSPKPHRGRGGPGL